MVIEQVEFENNSDFSVSVARMIQYKIIILLTFPNQCLSLTFYHHHRVLLLHSFGVVLVYLDHVGKVDHQNL